MNISVLQVPLQRRQEIPRPPAVLLLRALQDLRSVQIALCKFAFLFHLCSRPFLLLPAYGFCFSVTRIIVKLKSRTHLFSIFRWREPSSLPSATVVHLILSFSVSSSTSCHRCLLNVDVTFISYLFSPSSFPNYKVAHNLLAICYVQNSFHVVPPPFRKPTHFHATFSESEFTSSRNFISYCRIFTVRKYYSDVKVLLSNFFDCCDSPLSSRPLPKSTALQKPNIYSWLIFPSVPDFCMLFILILLCSARSS